ncbi:MAG: protein transport protein sft2 [Watsoniomyces obsoletus]|nr:MAG: protein transport protein sft2 [Watsoniomyces obsoletus]
MPEAITYHDMARMIKARVPGDGAGYQLVIHPRFGRWEYQDWVPSSQRHAGAQKNKEMAEDPDRFVPDLKHTYRGLDKLGLQHYTITQKSGTDLDVIPTSTTFHLTPDSIRSHGKQIIISLRPHLHLRVHCSLHGHVLPMSKEEYDQAINRWKRHTAMVPPYISLALVGPEWNIVVIDRNRLATTTVVSGFNWRDPTRGPCPITEPNQFRSALTSIPLGSVPNTPIYNWMSAASHQKRFNGLGTSHTNEILHRAWIHPDMPAREVWATQKTHLIDKIIEYCQLARSEEYCKHVPARPQGYSAFSFSPAITRYYNSSFTRVFRRTEPGRNVRVELDHYNHLVRWGCLDPKYVVAEAPTNHKPRFTDRPMMKEIPVYCWQQLHGGRTYVYSAILRPPIPNHSERSRLLQFDEAGRKALNATGATAELGIASFMDVKWFERRVEEKRKREREGRVGRPKKPAYKTGRVGRPRKNIDARDMMLSSEEEGEESDGRNLAHQGDGLMVNNDDMELLDMLGGLSTEALEEEIEAIDP